MSSTRVIKATVEGRSTLIQTESVARVVTVGVPGADGAQGVPGPPGAPGSAPQAYVHNQIAPASTWVIVHNLGFRPNVNVYDSGGTNVEGEIAQDSTNQMTLTFSAAFAGVAYLS